MAANVYLTGNQFTMSYTEGFLDFKYTPTYNILSYLEGLNDVGYPNPKFTADKEYYAMPDYRGIIMSGNGIGIATNSVVYLSSNGITYSNYTNPIQKTSNTLKFGKDLVLEWQSIFINTFVDVVLLTFTISPRSKQFLHFVDTESLYSFATTKSLLPHLAHM